MWQSDLLAEIQQIDHEQVPHGLYGLPDLLKSGTRFQPLARILGGRLFGDAQHLELDLAKRLGWKTRYAKQASLEFVLPTTLEVSIEIETHASTKVRQYGDSYHVDKAHGKGRPLGSNQIEKWISKLPKRARGGLPPELLKLLDSLPPEKRGNPKSRCNLLVAYVPRETDFTTLLEGATDPDFLARYGVSFAERRWEDPHQRGFWTGLFLWTHSNQQGESAPGE
ncbi:hypothetical protein [Luteolibacter marinus]|uniref:hypothetical protein n=1 Tax=Luteolibacter marinus TaxID=2776705 RepID=UPI0018678CAE|nr:hypothetical protein [Luteolibacter marinus]